LQSKPDALALMTESSLVVSVSSHTRLALFMVIALSTLVALDSAPSPPAEAPTGDPAPLPAAWEAAE
jgi:hypothetical protein